MIALPLMLCLARTGTALDGEAICQKAEALLTRLGIYGPRNPIEIVDSQYSTPEGTVTRWNLAYVCPSGAYINMMVQEDGRLVNLNYGHLYQDEQEMPGVQDPLLARRVADRLFSRIDHRQAEFQGVGYGPGTLSATYDLLVNGRKFFNQNPPYGYTFTWDARTQVFVSINISDTVPQVNGLVPKISESAAEAAFMAYAKTNPKRDPIASLLLAKTPQPPRIRCELGYYKFPGDKKARLVWRGQVGSWIDGKFMENGSLARIVDALAGKLIPVGPGGIY